MGSARAPRRGQHRGHPHPVGPPARRSNRALWTVAALVVALGAGIVVWGFTGRDEPVAMPLPEKTFDLSTTEATQLRDRMAGADLAGGTVPAGAGTAAAVAAGRAAGGTRRSSADAGAATAAAGANAGPTAPQDDPKAAAVQQDPPEVGAAAADYSRPNTLYIPSLGLQAPLEPETAQAGALVIPGDPQTVAWYSGSPAISDTSGTTLLAGHANYESTQGALYPLSTIAPGALIIVTDAAGNASRWLTVSLQVRDKNDLPVFPATGPRRLALVTCGGALLETERGRSYASNVIAEAIPA